MVSSVDRGDGRLSLQRRVGLVTVLHQVKVQAPVAILEVGRRCFLTGFRRTFCRKHSHRNKSLMDRALLARPPVQRRRDGPHDRLLQETISGRLDINIARGDAQPGYAVLGQRVEVSGGDLDVDVAWLGVPVVERHGFASYPADPLAGVVITQNRATARLPLAYTECRAELDAPPLCATHNGMLDLQWDSSSDASRTNIVRVWRSDFEPYMNIYNGDATATPVTMTGTLFGVPVDVPTEVGAMHGGRSVYQEIAGNWPYSRTIDAGATANSAG